MQLWKLASLLVVLQSCVGVEHNLPEGVELVDPKDFGLDGQIDLDKLLGNVKHLPIDTNALSSALGKPGLKTQVLTVGFDGSEGINLDDFELPQLKNDENAPLAAEAFKSFKNFFKNNQSSTPFEEAAASGLVIPGADQIASQIAAQQPQIVSTRPGPNGKRRTVMKRRKAKNGTVTTPPPSAPSAPAPSPKVIELDSSQIERLIASGKIGPPKSLTPGGPQVIELGQSDLDALLNSENGDEIKQILEGGESIKDFDLSTLSNAVPQTPSGPQVSPQYFETTEPQPQPSAPSAPRVVESRPPVSVAEIVTQPQPIQTTQVPEPTPYPTTVVTNPPQTVAPVTAPTSPTTTTTTGLPIIYQFRSTNDDIRSNFPLQPQGGNIPLQYYSSHADGQQQPRQFKTPTFEFISAPPVSFSSSILPNVPQNQQPQQQGQPQIFVQQQPQQYQPQYLNTPSFVIPDITTQRPVQQQPDSHNNILPAPQTSSHSEQLKGADSINENLVQQGNYLQNIHKVNLPHNSVKLVTPSPQVVHSVLNQVPASFQPSVLPNHVVNSPVLNPLSVNQPSNFLRVQQPQPQEPFRNTQLFNPAPTHSQPAPARPQNNFRFPTQSILGSGGPSRFRTSETQNPYFAQSSNIANLVLNSFVAGDGLNYRPKSSDSYQSPGI